MCKSSYEYFFRLSYRYCIVPCSLLTGLYVYASVFRSGPEHFFRLSYRYCIVPCSLLTGLYVYASVFRSGPEYFFRLSYRFCIVPCSLLTGLYVRIRICLRCGPVDRAGGTSLSGRRHSCVKGRGTRGGVFSLSAMQGSCSVQPVGSARPGWARFRLLFCLVLYLPAASELVLVTSIPPACLPRPSIGLRRSRGRGGEGGGERV